MAIRLLPFRQYNDHNVINLFAGDFSNGAALDTPFINGDNDNGVFVKVKVGDMTRAPVEYVTNAYLGKTSYPYIGRDQYPIVPLTFEPATTGSASMNELLLRSDAYDVRRVRIGDDELRLETGGGCQVITTVSGEVTVRTSCAQRTLGRHASALIPAATSEYRLGGAPGAVALLTIPR